MIEGKRILAIVPARGGSKGLPLKNLRPLNGVPLVALVGQVVQKVPEIDRAIVSTDHDEIAQVAGKAGLDAPFRRPPELSGDLIGDYDVLAHALAAVEAIDKVQYDIVLMLQPTSPQRTADHLRATLEKLISEELDAVWTVSKTDKKYHPLKQLELKDNLLQLWDKRGKAIIARQQLTPAFHRNGIAYAFTRACLCEQKTILGRRTGAVLIEELVANIDTEEDLQQAEKLISM